MTSVARKRLNTERKELQKDRPFGFYARPVKNKDGESDILKWECGIPGKQGTPWEKGTYKLMMTFTEEFPTRPPLCQFDPPLFHPNVFPSGTVCLSLLSEEKDWSPTITIKQLLLGIQDLLNNPNLSDPAQREAFLLCRDNPAAYIAKVRQLAEAYGS